MCLDDYVSDVYAHTEENASVVRVTNCKFMDAALELRRGSDCFDCTWKLSQKPVAGVLDDTATVLRDCRLDGFRQKGRQTCMRRFFVVVHKPRIARHVGGHYCGQPAFEPAQPLSHHSTQPFAATCTMDPIAAPPSAMSVHGSFETSPNVRSSVASGVDRTWRGQPISVEKDPSRTFGRIQV